MSPQAVEASKASIPYLPGLPAGRYRPHSCDRAYRPISPPRVS